MKKDFNPVIKLLCDKGYILPGDLVIVMQTQLNSWALLFGAVGGAIAGSKVQPYIVSVNNRGIRLFELDKKTYEYTNGMIDLPYSKIIKLRTGTFGGMSLKIKIEGFSISLQANNKMYGFDQKDSIKKCAELLKNHKI